MELRVVTCRNSAKQTNKQVKTDQQNCADLNGNCAALKLISILTQEFKKRQYHGYRITQKRDACFRGSSRWRTPTLSHATSWSCLSTRRPTSIACETAASTLRNRWNRPWSEPTFTASTTRITRVSSTWWSAVVSISYQLQDVLITHPGVLNIISCSEGMAPWVICLESGCAHRTMRKRNIIPRFQSESLMKVQKYRLL